MKRLPLTDDNDNYGTHLQASQFSITKLITRRVSLCEEVYYFDLYEFRKTKNWTKSIRITIFITMTRSHSLQLVQQIQSK